MKVRGRSIRAIPICKRPCSTAMHVPRSRRYRFRSSRSGNGPSVAASFCAWAVTTGRRPCRPADATLAPAAKLGVLTDRSGCHHGAAMPHATAVSCGAERAPRSRDCRRAAVESPPLALRPSAWPAAAPLPAQASRRVTTAWVRAAQPCGMNAATERILVSAQAPERFAVALPEIRVRVEGTARALDELDAAGIVREQRGSTRRPADPNASADEAEMRRAPHHTAPRLRCRLALPRLSSGLASGRAVSATRCNTVGSIA